MFCREGDTYMREKPDELGYLRPKVTNVTFGLSKIKIDREQSDPSRRLKSEKLILYDVSGRY